MPYRFTIVDQRTREPIKGEINFRIGEQKTLQGWPVGYEGIDLDEGVVDSYDYIMISAPGYATYTSPVAGVAYETEFRLVKNSPVVLWVAIGAAAAALGVAYYFEHRTKKRKTK